MPGDRDGRRRKPGRERNGDLNAAALFLFSAKTPAEKRNRKSMPRLLRFGEARRRKAKRKSGTKGHRFSIDNLFRV